MVTPGSTCGPTMQLGAFSTTWVHRAEKSREVLRKQKAPAGATFNVKPLISVPTADEVSRQRGEAGIRASGTVPAGSWARRI